MSVNSRRPSVRKRLTTLSRNCFYAITSLFFVVGRKVAFLESVNFCTCACMQLFNFRDRHVTTFRHRRGLYLPNAWSQTVQTSKRHTFRVSACQRYHWFGV